MTRLRPVNAGQRSDSMLFSGTIARRAVAGAIGAGAVAAAMLVGAAPGLAQPLPPPGPPPPPPLPNCTAADLAGVSGGVSFATSSYLFTHPEVNAFFTSLKGQPKAEIRDDVMSYLDQHPQVRAELTAIRQ